MKQFIQEMPTKFIKHSSANQPPSSRSLGWISRPTTFPHLFWKWTVSPYQLHSSTECWASVKDQPKKIHPQLRTGIPPASSRRCQAPWTASLRSAWSLPCLAWYSFAERKQAETPKLSLVDWSSVLLLLPTGLWMLLTVGPSRIVLCFLCPRTSHKCIGISLETLNYSHTNTMTQWSYIQWRCIQDKKNPKKKNEWKWWNCG